MRRSAVILVVPLLVVSGCGTGHRSSRSDLSGAPNVIGMSWPDAANRIGAAGLCYRWGTITLAVSGTHLGRVIGQRPRAGQRVTRLARVRIDIAQQVQEVREAPNYLIDQDPSCPWPGVPKFVGTR